MAPISSSRRVLISSATYKRQGGGSVQTQVVKPYLRMLMRKIAMTRIIVYGTDKDK
jgi:hypothetical protein